jgi:hypothetical protein
MRISSEEFYISSEISSYEKKALPSRNEIDKLSNILEIALKQTPSIFLHEEQKRFFSLVGRCHTISMNQKIERLSFMSEKNISLEAALKLHKKILKLLEDPSLSKSQVIELATIDQKLCAYHSIVDPRIDPVKITFSLDLTPFELAEAALSLMELAEFLYEDKIEKFWTFYKKHPLKGLLEKHIERKHSSEVWHLIESCFRCALHVSRGIDLGIYPSKKAIDESFTRKFF